MKKPIFLLTAAACVLGLMIQPAQAQLINYNRKKIDSLKRSEPVAPTSEVEPSLDLPQAVEEIEVSPANSSLDQFLTSQPEVATRIEHIYDLDRDGRLQQNEITEFLADVVASVERRGSFSISSNLLKLFDKDEDGQISRLEADQIKQILD